MADYPIPAGLDQYIRCDIPGCEVSVFSLTGERHRCSAHGGRPGWPEIRTSIDGTLSVPAADASSPSAAEAPA